MRLLARRAPTDPVTYVRVFTLSGGATRRLMMLQPVRMKLLLLSSAPCSQRRCQTMFRYGDSPGPHCTQLGYAVNFIFVFTTMFLQDAASSVSRATAEFSPAEVAHSMSAGGRADTFGTSRSNRPVRTDMRYVALQPLVCECTMRTLQALMSPSLGSLLAPSL